jgi:hypothetical protein
MKVDICFTYTYYLYVFQMYFWQTLKFGMICKKMLSVVLKMYI